MLSAFAARRSRVPTLGPGDMNDPPRSDSEVEELPASSKVPLKRRSETVEESSASRKRKRVSQRTKETNVSQPKVSFTPLREYSPSALVASSQAAAMMEIDALGGDPIISTFTPSLDQNVFFDDTQSAVYLVLSPSETLSFVGTVSITVLQGTISLFSSLLHASTGHYRVYAPKNYPVATIEAIEAPKELENRTPLPAFLESSVNQSQTVIMVQDLHSGIQGLAKIFGIQQSTFETLNELQFDFKLREFHPILHGSAAHPPFQKPSSWTYTLEQLTDEVECPVLLVKGPKNSGKSMFGRILVNQLLQRYRQVAYLDCDVGQTEFTPPGLVSLHVLSKPLLGPPFTHIHPAFRAHFVGSTSIRSSSRHYHDCVTDLLDVYRLSIKYGYNVEDRNDGEPDTAQSSSIEIIPLVINTFGWTKGIGADVLLRVEEKSEVTHIFTFEPPIQDSAWNLDDIPRIPGVRYTSLESVKPSRFDTSPSDKRALMMMSYFHHNEKSSSSIWNTTTPLCAMPPWEVTWASAIDRIILIGTGSEDVHRSEVLRALNGSIVALLAIDSIMPGWSESNKNMGNPPYIQGSEPPSPTLSRCIGYALVRSVRASTGTLQILTPLSPDRLLQVRVLVMGEIKLPIWGMLDHRAESKSTGQIAGVDLASVPFLQWTSGPQDALGSKRLRVRRNLMRKSQL